MWGLEEPRDDGPTADAAASPRWRTPFHVKRW